MWVKPEFEIRMVEKMKNTSEVCAAILTSELVSMLSSVKYDILIVSSFIFTPIQ